MIKQKRVVGIIHPWMPQYRTRFFTLLKELLCDESIELHVFYGETPPEWRARNDKGDLSDATELATRFIKLGSRVVCFKSVAEVWNFGPYDLLIVEQAIRNIETYRILLSKRRYGKLAYWGHGRTYTVQKGQLEERLKTWLSLQAGWFFGYTDGGVDGLVKEGFSRSRTTVVQNSIDTSEFRRSLGEVADSELLEFRAEHDLLEDTALYIGGLDASKRIDFLLEASKLVYEECPSFRLLVAGGGDLYREVANQAGSEPWLKVLGSVFGRDKALAFRASRFLMIPGRVGLVAVDSLVSGKPIVTTDWPLHAPEFEYLENGVTAVVADNEVAAYSKAVKSLLLDRPRSEAMGANCRSEGANYSVESMADRFARGVLGALGDPREGSDG